MALTNFRINYKMHKKASIDLIANYQSKMHNRVTPRDHVKIAFSEFFTMS